MSCSSWLDANAAEIEELRVQLAGAKAELKTSDEYLEIANSDCSTLRAQLAAAEKERDRIQNAMQGVAASHVQIREERDALAARVAQLEAVNEEQAAMHRADIVRMENEYDRDMAACRAEGREEAEKVHVIDRADVYRVAHANGREEERRDVVAWLRGTRGAGVAYAREIEACQHIGAAEKEGK